MQKNWVINFKIIMQSGYRDEEVDISIYNSMIQFKW